MNGRLVRVKNTATSRPHTGQGAVPSSGMAGVSSMQSQSMLGTRFSRLLLVFRDTSLKAIAWGAKLPLRDTMRLQSALYRSFLLGLNVSIQPFAKRCNYSFLGVRA